MATLSQEIKRRNISVYRLTQLLDLDPKASCFRVSQKINGKISMSVAELKQICELISVESKQKLNPKDVEFKVDRILMR